MVGQTISHYKILKKIGQGGMGEVYQAEDLSLDRKVALKFLPIDLQQDETARKRFLREAKSAAALDHPYICHIHEAGESDGQGFIAMEYVDGETLKDRLGKGPVPLAEALRTASEMAEALEEAHRKGIIHRDVKPSNVMVMASGHVKVMDFGLAKQLLPAEGIGSEDQTLSASLTKSGSTPGTLAYMSPEQLRAGEVDTRSDIFSFGVVLYEMLTQIHPFKKDSPMETAQAILSDTPAPLSRYLDEVHPLLRYLVKKTLAKDPDRRFQLFREVRTHLEDLIEEMAESPAVDVPRDTTGLGGERPAAKSWRRAIPWSMMALMALIAAVAIWREAPPAQHPVSRVTIKLPPGQNVAGRAAIALSTDGQTLAYVAQEGGVQRLYVRPMDEFEAKPIPGSEGAEGPFFSPDGNWVGFCADSKLKRVSTSGGSPLIICDYPRMSWGGGNYCQRELGARRDDPFRSSGYPWPLAGFGPRGNTRASNPQLSGRVCGSAPVPAGSPRREGGSIYQLCYGVRPAHHGAFPRDWRAAEPGQAGRLCPLPAHRTPGVLLGKQLIGGAV